MSYDLKLFEHKAVRTHWDEEQETWYFNVTDVIDVLTESADAKQYIKKMRKRDPELDANWGTICTPVKMVAKDGKKRNVFLVSKQEIKEYSPTSKNLTKLQDMVEIMQGLKRLEGSV